MEKKKDFDVKASSPEKILIVENKMLTEALHSSHQKLEKIVVEYRFKEKLLNKKITELKERESKLKGEISGKNKKLQILSKKIRVLREKDDSIPDRPKESGSERSKITRILRHLFAKTDYDKIYKVIKKSDLFSSDWYLTKYTDVSETGIDPIEHYIKYGASELRDPSENFSTSKYLQFNKDVKESGINPLYHYEIFGKKEDRKY